MKRRAHTRIGKNGQQVRVAEHDVRVDPAKQPGVGVSDAQHARLRIHAERAVERGGADFMVFDDSDPGAGADGETPFHEPDDSGFGGDSRDDGFVEFQGGDDLFGIDGDDDSGVGDLMFGGGMSRNGLEYATRQGMLRRGGSSGPHTPPTGLKFDPETSFFGRLFRSFGAGGGGQG